jgi:hypothetical protein
LEKDGFEVGSAEGEIFKLEARGGGGFEKPRKIGGVVDGELRGGIDEGTAVGGCPAGEAMLKRAMTRDEALKEAWTSA